MPTDVKKDTGGAVVAACLTALGALVVFDTTTYADSDSAVFPRTFAIVMILASVAYIVTWLMGRGASAGEAEAGSMPRRVLLVAIMLGGTLAMPWVGFLAASIPVFAALTLVAMYDPWTKARAVVYPLVGIAIVLGFYVLFKEVLLVPLPTASLFQG